eukprot:gene26037-32003_t
MSFLLFALGSVAAIAGLPTTLPSHPRLIIRANDLDRIKVNNAVANNVATVAAAAVDVPWPLTQLPVTRGGASKATTVVLTDFGGVADGGKTDNNGAFMQAF